MNIRNNKGFNLVELMIVLVIMSVLMMVAAPSYMAWLTNMRVKSIAEGINLGVTQARAEAIRRNQEIIFILHNDTSWEIKDLNDVIINRKESTESSSGIALTVTPNDANTLTFNGFGAVASNIDATNPITSVLVDSANRISGVNPMSVKIGKGGGTLTCTSDCDSRNIN
jgi:type IV fimbrial biogenesis protein FimT